MGVRLLDACRWSYHHVQHWLPWLVSVCHDGRDFDTQCYTVLLSTLRAVLTIITPWLPAGMSAATIILIVTVVFIVIIKVVELP